ncbi:S-methyl-5-thioribose kinase [Leucobacter chromiireducens]|uniref:S-methyl-5-thioribose kinase n=1 Tax=Leucobacter chromiireducens subsp. solipictus TaxID=398235 RepID=A0ABS1SDM9_9MICO|nr:S-methyl-5-thioribose kinase [Leucobacter chromiireducens]MBL3678639.1 S-methyl-5-thioribose kinase [Leucobacter chromiireducens subsp. solipictus]
MSHEYTFLDADNIAEYLRSRPETHDRIDADRIASIREIGDGNLNLVFHILDADDRGIILKQALPYVRMTGAGWPMTPERAAREADSLQTHHALTPELVVDVILYDPERYILALEDLSDYAVWRDALNRSERHEDVARRLGEYVAALAVGTSILGQDRQLVAQRIAETQNPELCTITEDLVFTEPVFDTGRNEVLPENAADAADLAADPAFAAAMAEAKWRFMTQAEALIHGDLHTGSVMVRGAEGAVAESVKVFDSEFAFYGPIAFDLGALFANYSFASARATALGEHERAAWALSLVAETWDAFEREFLARAETWQETQLFGSAFARQRLDRIRREAFLFASAKMARRIVGAAKVRDIESLEPALRAPAARSVLAAARALAASWDSVQDIAEFARTVGAELLRA